MTDPPSAPHASTFRRDVTASTLFGAPSLAIRSLGAFIAVNRLGAGTAWIGVMSGAVYAGFLLNAFFSRASRGINLRQGIVALVVVSSLLTAIAAFEKTPVAYGVLVIGAFVLFGLYQVQYNTLLRHLYTSDERPKRLSARFLVISLAGVGMSALFGRMSSLRSGHTSAFLLAALLMLASAAVFRSIRSAADHQTESFRFRSVLKTIFGDQRLRRAALLLTLYGWVGPGFKTIAVVIYKFAGFDEWQVGLQESLATTGTVLAALLVTPRIPFRGGISNFRLCFSAAALFTLVALAAVIIAPAAWIFALMALANFVFGVSAAGFTLAMQTIGPNLAPPERTSLYVTSIMFVQGLRGMILPVVVAAIAGLAGLETTLLITAAFAAACTVGVWLPGIDGKPRGVR